MQNSPKIPWKGYISITVVALTISVYLMIDRGVFAQTDIAEIYKLLCDAFFVPGIIFSCLGVLVAVSNEGFFDIFSYSMRIFVDSFTRNKNFRNEYQTYFDYTRRNKEKNTNVKFVLHVGLAFIAIGTIFNILFYSVYVPSQV